MSERSFKQDVSGALRLLGITILETIILFFSGALGLSVWENNLGMTLVFLIVILIYMGLMASLIEPYTEEKGN